MIDLYNKNKIDYFNTYLEKINLNIQFPYNTDDSESNFFGNTKIGYYNDNSFVFNDEYFYLNEIFLCNVN